MNSMYDTRLLNMPNFRQATYGYAAPAAQVLNPLVSSPAPVVQTVPTAPAVVVAPPPAPAPAVTIVTPGPQAPAPTAANPVPVQQQYSGWGMFWMFVGVAGAVTVGTYAAGVARDAMLMRKITGR